MNNRLWLRTMFVLGLILSIVAGCAPAPVVRSEAVLWDARLTQLKAGIAPAACYDKPRFEIIEAWITVQGNWDDPAIPSFAKARQRDYLGGDRHAWGLALDPQGNAYIQPGYVLAWPDGKQGAVGEPGNGQWANAILQAGFDPNVTGGPYTWQKGPSSVAPCGAETLTGLGMPFSLPWLTASAVEEGGWHVSFFAVFQLVEAQPPMATGTPSVAPTTPATPFSTPTLVFTPTPAPTPLSGAYWLRWGPFKLAVELEPRP